QDNNTQAIPQDNKTSDEKDGNITDTIQDSIDYIEIAETEKRNINTEKYLKYIFITITLITIIYIMFRIYRKKNSLNTLLKK
ncbi:MAG: hypothetical protein KAR23_02680, partial [Candidatus Aenigmarchaeota archaeon]|nr:hypothetical protein [Candidatus Aenigmarchaeota archaeon]